MVTPWSCYRCHRSAGRVNGQCVLCRNCRADIARQGLCWCNACKQVVSPVSYSHINSVCLACHAARQRKIRAKSPTIRERARQTNRAWKEANADANKANIAQWRATHPKWSRKYQSHQSAYSKARYATDEAYRERRKAASRAYRERMR